MPHKTPQKINIVIPVYNEESTIYDVLSNLVDTTWIDKIIVVDDCSTDHSAKIIKSFPVIYLKNIRNMGSGYSLMRGLRYSALQKNVSFTATMDADGQHTRGDLRKLYSAIRNNNELIVHGARNILKDAPLIKKISSFTAWKVLELLYGEFIRDPFCGLNIYHNSTIKHLRFSNGYEWPINLMILMQSLGKRVITKQIPARYSKYSLSKGMTFSTSLKVFLQILHKRIREIINEKSFSRNQSILPTNWRD